MSAVAKTCRKCGVTKPGSDFYRNATQRDGLQSHCKPCHTAGSRAWEKANPERANENAREWGRRHPERKRAERKRNAGRYLLQKRAKNVVYRAIRRGLITRPTTCESCGSTGQIDAHHEDYGKPLEIAWLCRGCHTERHVLLRRRP